MNKHLIALTILALLPTAHAGELGRLFNTPQQRQQLEYQEASDYKEDAGGQHYPQPHHRQRRRAETGRQPHHLGQWQSPGCGTWQRQHASCRRRHRARQGPAGTYQGRAENPA
ncbi:MAG: hypothetical protein HZB95_10355 [Nitrosomonadales bacterium]|nr:hypothetical protein [Nitrosomonadales bacterium]